jgi:serine/threonine-protein kinase
MTHPDAHQLDARAREAVARLLGAAQAERDAELARLRTTDPDLSERIDVLLATAQEADATRAMTAAQTDALRDAAAAAALRGGMVIAGYRLLRKLGEGGMAAVWLAERADGQLDRKFAIKLPLRPHLEGILAERFARERDVLTALDHPHIARLYDAGVSAQGRPFIALEYVPGKPIIEYAHAAGLGQRQRLQLFMQVLDAVDHAHRQLVVHRDLKPSNILVTEEGVVKLLDFGIAKLLSDSPDDLALTQDVGSVLTPRYAAPEQALGRTITTATDIYSAGVVLYELLAGRMPYGRESRSAIQAVQALLDERPEPPRLDADLDTVLLKALAKRPALRYASIERFAEDLRRVLAHEPILARRVPWWQRVRLWARRQRNVAAAAAAGGIVLAVVLGVAVRSQLQARAERERGDAVRDFIYAMVSDAEPAQGRSEVTGRELVEGAIARAEQEFAGQPRLRGELLAELGRVQFRLNHMRGALPTLTQAVQLLEAQAPKDDPALNRARTLLAIARSREAGDEAETLARTALAQCTRSGAACTAVRAQAHYALVARASYRGQANAMLEHSRAMLAESERLAAPGDVIDALETLATGARTAGRLEEATAAITRAQALARGVNLKSANRQRLDLLQAAIDIDLGRYAPAAAQLAALAASAPNDSERAIRLRLLTEAELGQGRATAALRAAQAAVDSLPGGNHPLERGSARQALARSAAFAGEAKLADAMLAQSAELMRDAGMGASAAWARRARQLEAEVALRAGRTDAALQALGAALEAGGTVALLDQSRTLTLLACADAARGDTAAALPRLREAESAAKQVLPPQHPWFDRLALATAALQGRPDAARLRRTLDRAPSDHLWRNRPPQRCIDFF